MRKEFGAIAVGFGVEIVFLILSLTVDELKPWIIPLGLVFGGVLILGGIGVIVWPNKRNPKSVEGDTTSSPVATVMRLSVELAEPYVLGPGIPGGQFGHSDDTQTWLRLSVKNTNSQTVKRCYGKLIDYYPLTQGEKSEGLKIFSEPLPPEGHHFVWEPKDDAPIETDIPGNRSEAFLYLVVLPRERHYAFSHPGRTGIGYRTVALGDFQITIEIGALEENFPATVVSYVFNKNHTLKNVSLDDVTSNKADSRDSTKKFDD